MRSEMRIQLDKWLEEEFHILLGDTDAIIPNCEGDLILLWMSTDFQTDITAVRCEFDRVAKQVYQ